MWEESSRRLCFQHPRKKAVGTFPDCLSCPIVRLRTADVSPIKHHKTQQTSVQSITPHLNVTSSSHRKALKPSAPTSLFHSLPTSMPKNFYPLSTISSRISYLGHLLRHADSLEHIATFQTAHVHILAYKSPISHQVHHNTYHHPTAKEVAETYSRCFGNTNFWRARRPVAPG